MLWMFGIQKNYDKEIGISKEQERLEQLEFF